MSAIIIGGNECMGRTYCNLCAKYNITARTIPLKKGSFANQLGKPDYIFVCMDTVSHPLVISAQKEARKHGAQLVRLRRGSASALERELIRVTAAPPGIQSAHSRTDARDRVLSPTAAYR